MLVKKLIACSLSLSKSKARIGLEHQRLKEKLPDPSILLIPGLVIESTESKEKKCDIETGLRLALSLLS